MKKTIVFVLMLICLAGCGNGDNVSPVYQTIYDDIANVLLVQNTNNALYEEVLSTVTDYISDPSPLKLEATKQIATQNMRTILESKRYESTLTDSDLTFMIDNKIDTADYKAVFNQQDYNKNVYEYDITLLIYHLNSPDTSTLIENITFKTKFQERSRQLTALGINHLFAEVDDKNAAYFKSEIMPQIGSIMQDNLPWLNEKKILEEKADVVLGQIELLISEYEEYVNSMEIKLLTEEKAVLDGLISSGLSKEEAEKVIKNIKKLSQIEVADLMNGIE